MLDKSKYPNKQSIGEGIRKGADSYFKGVTKGKEVIGKVVKKVVVKTEEKK